MYLSDLFPDTEVKIGYIQFGEQTEEEGGYLSELTPTLFIVHCSLFTVHCSLFIASHSHGSSLRNFAIISSIPLSREAKSISPSLQ